MTLWKGRFRGRLHPEALRFSSSLAVDQRLVREDIDGSLAHVAMLADRKILSLPDARKISAALRSIRREISRDPLSLQGKGRFVAEDIHMAVEAWLIEKVGAIGGALHTARSRNDQVALDTRLFLRSQLQEIGVGVRTLQKALLARARRYAGVMMPGYTHLQRAQPILLAHHLLAYIEMLERDRSRFADCLRRSDASPLGAGALAGTSFRIDRHVTAKALGFSSIAENSIDAVSDRDAPIEFLAGCAITMMHLSRLAEELVLWSSQEWHFVELDDAVTTGSSIMPQKKNPDMAELVRGKTGRVYGGLVALLTVMKGLPLAYNRDMQEDKEPLFDAADTVRSSLSIMALMIGTVRFDRSRFEQELKADFLVATELADYLVRKGMPFREAHAVVGAVVKECERKRVGLKDLPLQAYRRHTPLFAADLYRVLDPRSSLAAKRSAGSTAPQEVQKALVRWKRKLSEKIN